MDKEFKPTKYMVKLLQAYLALEPNEVPTNTLLAEKSGLCRKTITRLSRKVPFQRWWNEQISKHISARLDKVWTAVYHAALSGDSSHAKLFIERFDPGYKPTTKKEEEVKRTIQLILSGNGKEEQKYSRVHNVNATTDN